MQWAVCMETETGEFRCKSGLLGAMRRETRWETEVETS